jgi:hypothetical protein
MAIKAACPSCGRQLKVKDELAGKKVKCPGCGDHVRIPAGEGEQAEAPPAKPVTKRREKPKETSPEEKKGLDLAPSDPEPEKPPSKAITRSRPRSSAGRPALAPSPSANTGGISPWLKLRLIGGAVGLVIFIVSSLFYGSSAYDASFGKVQVGMSRAQVIQLMGAPDLEEGELIAWEATDRVSRYRTKSTFYLVFMEGGKVAEKERMTEEELERRKRQNR